MAKIIILIGKTGSGKSTLANVISGTNKFNKFENKKECQEDIKKMLVEKELCEIVNSCQGRIVHVSNPPIEGKSGEELEMNEEERDESRKVLLSHLHQIDNSFQSGEDYR